MTDRLPETSLRLGLPSGSLQASTFDLFGRAGYRVSVSDRSVFPRVDDDKINLEEGQRFLEHNVKAEECYDFYACIRRELRAEKGKKKAKV